MVPTGGSDSHEPITRATMFVAATEPTEAALREGILRGRVCVRAPQPCSLAAHADRSDAPPAGVGDAIRAERKIELRWNGRGILYRDGGRLGEWAAGTTIAVDDRACHLLRLAMAGGYSAPIYVNCDFAELLVSGAGATSTR
jgi:hypothetical protein